MVEEKALHLFPMSNICKGDLISTYWSVITHLICSFSVAGALTAKDIRQDYRPC